MCHHPRRSTTSHRVIRWRRGALHVLALAVSFPTTVVRGEFQILLQDGEGGPSQPPLPSDAPSDVPSTSPSLSPPSVPTPSSVVPTVTTTFRPTAIPICPLEWTTYRTCFQDQMPSSAAQNCDVCVGASLPDPRQDATCEDYSAGICDALTKTCECQPCHDDIELYFRCTYEALGLNCSLDCGTVPDGAPSPSPTTARTPSSVATETNFTTNETRSTSGATAAAAMRGWGRSPWGRAALASAAILAGGLAGL